MHLAQTKIGVQQGEEHIDPDSGVTSDLVNIAARNEFGVPQRRIPERSFIRSTADEIREEMHRRIIPRELSQIYLGRETVQQALARIGEHVEAKIKQKIVDLKTPPNALATQIAKGRGIMLVDNPLIDTGQLRQSIRHVEEIRE